GGFGSVGGAEMEGDGFADGVDAGGDELGGLEVAAGECGFGVAGFFEETVEEDNEGGEAAGVAVAEVEVAEEAAFAGGFAENDEGAVALPEEDLIGVFAGRFGGGLDEEALPVEVAHERVVFGDERGGEALGGRLAFG